MRLARVLAALAVAANAIAGSALAAVTADPTGLWLTEDGSAVVRIAPCVLALCGTVVWSQKPADAMGRPLCELAVLGEVKQTGADSWGKCWVYSPKADGKYAVTLKLAGEGAVALHVAAGLFGRDQTWTRPLQPVAPCAP